MSIAITEGIMSGIKTVNIHGREYTRFTLTIQHYPRPGEPDRKTLLLAEVRDSALMSGIKQGDRLRLSGNLESFPQGEQEGIKLIVSEIERLNVRQQPQQEEQGVLFV